MYDDIEVYKQGYRDGFREASIWSNAPYGPQPPGVPPYTDASFGRFQTLSSSAPPQNPRSSFESHLYAFIGAVIGVSIVVVGIWFFVIHGIVHNFPW